MMTKDTNFTTPPGHRGFLAKKLFAAAGTIIDGSIARIEENGGGPAEQHTHEHNHLFIVVEGEARILLGDGTVVVRENESFLVEGTTPHSVWNNAPRTTVMIGISVTRE
ncbi:MAG: cupin domain-containing protein [Alistipes sp.]|jgi:mannose-6-phosphate isomerase-like protein (cupin superfamily)|nr:cupin domain-containing protein [Alistipes sp.]